MTSMAFDVVNFAADIRLGGVPSLFLTAGPTLSQLNLDPNLCPFLDEVEMAEDIDEPSEEMDENQMAFVGSDGISVGDAHAQIEDPPLMEMLRSTVTDSAKMEEELKRVTPQLKVTVRANLKDWRMHAEQMLRMERELREQFGELKPFMARTGEEIGQAMERIQMRENHLNEQFSSLLQLYRNRQNDVAVTEQYRESIGTINSQTETLNALNDEVSLPIG